MGTHISLPLDGPEVVCFFLLVLCVCCATLKHPTGTITSVNVRFEDGEYEINETDEFDFAEARPHEARNAESKRKRKKKADE